MHDKTGPKVTGYWEMNSSSGGKVLNGLNSYQFRLMNIDKPLSHQAEQLLLLGIDQCLVRNIQRVITRVNLIKS